ncbi:hypothetical protein QUA96_20995 [Microcoleus sp. F6_B3]
MVEIGFLGRTYARADKKPGFLPNLRTAAEDLRKKTRFLTTRASRSMSRKKKTALREAVFDRTIVFATAGHLTFPTATNAGFTATEV